MHGFKKPENKDQLNKTFWEITITFIAVKIIINTQSWKWLDGMWNSNDELP